MRIVSTGIVFLTFCSSLAPQCIPRVNASEPKSAGPTPAISEKEAIPTINWRDANAYVDREVFAVGQVVRTGTSRTGNVFLNFDSKDHESLTIFIRSDAVKAFGKAPEQLYAHQRIRVRGFVYLYSGVPNIEVQRPEFIEIVAADEALANSSSPLTSRPAAAEGILAVATYNVLNLFDEFDDPYHQDETTPTKPRDELEHLASSIRSLNADIIAFQEIENREYLERFLNVFLRDMGYQHVVLFEGNDFRRSIEVAIASRFPVGPVTSYRHLRQKAPDGSVQRLQRDLLRARIEPPGCEPFDMFVVHLKSKGSGGDQGLAVRTAEASLIRGVLDNLLSDKQDARFLICGDFNDYIDSTPVSIILGEGRKQLATFVSEIPEQNQITYNKEPYRSMIDFIFASPAMAKSYVAQSYGVVSGSPETTGSDHNPVLARFECK